MQLRVILLIAVGLILPLVSSPQLRAQDPGRHCLDSTQRFDLVSDFEIVVPAQIGELKGLRFILDTGSSHSVIDRRVADQLGLHPFDGQVFSFNRNLPIAWADVPEIQVGPMRVEGMRVMVGRLGDISEIARGADGIIGLDVLSRARKIDVDYEQRTISFDLGERCEMRPEAAKALSVTLAIQGVPMHLLVDSGLRYVLLYKDRIATAIPHLRLEGESRGAAIGRLRATQVNLPGVPAFGREAVTSVFLIERNGAAQLGGLDGYLAPAALHARRVELDFAANTLRWQ